MTATAKTLARLANLTAQLAPMRMRLHPRIAVIVLAASLIGVALFLYAPARLGLLWLIGMGGIILPLLIIKSRQSHMGEIDISQMAEETDAPISDHKTLLDDAGSALGYPIVLERKLWLSARSERLRASRLRLVRGRRMFRAQSAPRRRPIPPFDPEAR
jgi:hypothetical protein